MHEKENKNLMKKKHSDLVNMHIQNQVNESI